MAEGDLEGEGVCQKKKLSCLIRLIIAIYISTNFEIDFFVYVSLN